MESLLLEAAYNSNKVGNNNNNNNKPVNKDEIVKMSKEKKNNGEKIEIKVGNSGLIIDDSNINSNNKLLTSQKDELLRQYYNEYSFPDYLYIKDVGNLKNSVKIKNNPNINKDEDVSNGNSVSSLTISKVDNIPFIREYSV
ncbi:hypothetical protein CmeUKMEL1_06145 [Cryptosporidium meleagridis]|uniref:Uncharacterized protein n=1 Tax=Cryptosporidium meleagridis TaxID=93969 RepID=A0A2P4YZD5_9CRYT|nr:hypothetical protein CmeUKMEL1_06145 [Cryptosporidium meleagridis]